VTGRRGFTLLEMLVATTILAVAVVGLLNGLSGATRNAARLREYDRAVQLARLRMNDLLADTNTPHDMPIGGPFDPQQTGGIEAGWRAIVSTDDVSPVAINDDFAIDRVQLEVWWMAGGQRRSFMLEGYRRRLMKPEEVGWKKGQQR
jgi:general secretion pathway protein I